MTLPPLPEPDTHCFDDDTGLDVWSHSPDQMRAYGEACAAAERERLTTDCAGLRLALNRAESRIQELLVTTQGEPVAWPARHVSLKQRKDKTLRLTLDLNAVEGWPNYWVMRSDSRGKCSTPSGCAAHGCHGECLQTAPQQRQPLTDEQILTAAGRLPGWLRHHEELDCDDLIDFARAVEAAHGIGNPRQTPVALFR